MQIPFTKPDVSAQLVFIELLRRKSQCVVPAVGAVLPLADWPVYGSNGGRKSQQLKWRLRVISPSMCCAKNEPTPRKVHLGGKMGIFALTGTINAMCLTCEVSGGGKAVCIHGPVDSVAVQVCHLQCGCLHVQVTGMALNNAGFEVVGSSESDTERALDLCSVHDSPHCSAASTASSPMFVTPEFATLSPESCPLIDTPVFALSPESGPSYVCVCNSDHTFAAGIDDGWFGVGGFCWFVSWKSIAFSCNNRFV